MKLLVTGADGFIGSHLVRRLPPTRDTHLHCGLSESVPALKNAGFHNVTHGDLSGPDAADALPNEDVDVLIHLAGLPAGTEEELRISNLAVTQQVAEWARRHAVKRIVFASTAAIYGDTCEEPATEEFDPAPQTAYAKSKQESELMLQEFGAGGPDILNLRMPHAYGPGKHVGVFAAILSRLLAGDVVQLNGDGNEKRDFIFIDDVTAAFLSAIDLDNLFGVNAFNIGSGVSLSLREACSIIGEVLGVKPEVRLTGKPAGQPHCIQLNVEKAARLLGWRAQVGLAEGVRRLLNSRLRGRTTASQGR